MVDDLIIYDDASTDGSFEYCLENTPYVLRGSRHGELAVKQQWSVLMEKAIELKPDFILWMDADEVLAVTPESLQELCEYCLDQQAAGLSFNRKNLWRSQSWIRLDSQFDQEWFVKLWRVTPDIRERVENLGGHPSEIKPEVLVIPIEGVNIFHYGFTSSRQIGYRYYRKRVEGNRGYMNLDRYLIEDRLELEKVSQSSMPSGLWIDDSRPQTLKVLEPFTQIETTWEEIEPFLRNDSDRGIQPVTPIPPRYEVSIIITAFQRAHLLKWQLYSIAQQKIPFPFETIVINDGLPDGSQEVCIPYKERLNIKYIFSGQRNLNGVIKWRASGFPINIAARQAEGKVLIIACGEMFHLNETIRQLTEPVQETPKRIAIPCVVKNDQDGLFLDHLNNHHQGIFNWRLLRLFNRCPNYDERLPYLMAISREQFFEIGGYDEDFTGIAHEDGDLVARLLMNGCEYDTTDAKTIHLYHPHFWEGKEYAPESLFDLNLYYYRNQRLKKILRNENWEWGRMQT